MRGQKLFETFRQGEDEVYTVSLATQLKVLAELERRCHDLMQEVELLSQRQEVLNGMVEVGYRAKRPKSILKRFSKS